MYLWISFGIMILTGCVGKVQNAQRLRDLEFVILSPEEIPEEFQQVIEKKQSKPFRLTYRDDGQLYLAEGYGEKPKTGYSVIVKAVYETEDAIHIHTNLMGPDKGEEVKEISTYPYIVVKVKDIKKSAIFD